MKKILLLAVLLGYLTCTAQEQLAVANNDFAFRIYQATRPDSANFFISPFSLFLALGMVHEGSGSTTRSELDQLLSTLHVADRSRSYAQLIRETLEVQNGRTCLQIPENNNAENKLLLANSMWINSSIPVHKVYIENVAQNYSSEVFQFNAGNLTDANQRLNTWIADKTNDKIRGSIELDAYTQVAIINAIYFMGEWQSPFDEKKTKEKIFFTLSGKKIKMDFMNTQVFLSYYEDADIQSVGIPYNCDEFEMIILLPKKKSGIIKLEKKLNAEYFGKLQRSSHEVILSVPKFRIESEIYPKESIINMGHPEMFSDHADFKTMSDTPLKISNIIHKTYIDVNEARTEATAYTEVEMVVTGGEGGEPVQPPPPKVFNANHSFVFLIVDNRSKAILFIGRVTGNRSDWQN